MSTNEHRSTAGGCVRTALIDDAIKAGRKWRNAVKRGDCTPITAWMGSGVGYPYMTEAEERAARSAFMCALRTVVALAAFALAPLAHAAPPAAPQGARCATATYIRPDDGAIVTRYVCVVAAPAAKVAGGVR